MNRMSDVTVVAAPNPQFVTSAPVVFVVDESPTVRESLEFLISSAGWRVILFAAVKDFLAYSGFTAPSCLVLRPGLAEMSALELQGLLALRDELPIIFIDGLVDVPGSIHTPNARATEFPTMPFQDHQLLSAIPRALELSREATMQNAEMLTLRDRYASLSDRQRDVMKLVVSGLLNKQIACELGIKELTVKVHRGNVMRKMAADSLAELVTMAVRMQIVSLRSRRGYEQVRACSFLPPLPQQAKAPEVRTFLPAAMQTLHVRNAVADCTA